MIPNVKTPKINIKTQLSKSYSIQNINHMVDELEAVKQSIYILLNTERYEHAIYSWNYGVELKGLVGKSNGYVYSELDRRIEEALLQDERVKSVTSFTFVSTRNKLNVDFMVNTIYGSYQEEVTLDV